ncbi:glycosyltransferase family 92 protein [Aquirufa antheringensis]|uniref:glycosyltransferase family 92 protein n=1 Tax=Aquirufa antheringensis TaxID=2516559 RepID=UPI0022A8A48F|nr:glycosyltransferase family 92 protein [Aquirufa antheringensis]MCZ2486953.1 glycosyltransferase family 92 protein [Aquirufa antheringensis]
MRKKENNYFIFGPEVDYNFKFYVKVLLSYFLDFYFSVILNIINKTVSNKKYKISICTIFKNESHNFHEWVEYHRIIGIEHFYLYNNFSDDDYLEVLTPYIEEGLVTLINWPFPMGQFSAYENFYKNYYSDSSWIIFLDLDEFITLLNKDNLFDWLEQFKLYPGVILYWKMFGTSGLYEHDFNKLTIEQYHVCWPKMYNIGKTFINTNFKIAFFDSMVHHSPVFKIKLFCFNILIPSINEFKRFFIYDFHRVGFLNSNFSVQINHYWSKSYNYYVERKLKRGDVNNHERNINIFYAHEENNSSSDYSIFRNIIKLKSIIDEK